MRSLAIFFVVFAAGLDCWSCRAMFMLQETRKVPIDRLFTNLQQRLARNTNDFLVTYHLARLHSMAYATNLVEVDMTQDEGNPVFYYPTRDSGVPQTIAPPRTPQARQAALKHLTNAILFYERASVLLKKSTNLNEQRWLILPTELGHAWCLDQAGRLQEALDAYRKTFKIAWKTEVIGEFDLKEWLQERWDDVRSGRNPLHRSQRNFLGPGVCYSEEIIGYLLKRLDPVKDADEIAQLMKNRKTLLSLGRAVTPIIVPLEREARLTELVDESAAVTFDLDGSRLPWQWGWITPKAAWLVYDSDGNGRITSGLQMFGSVTFWIFWRDGYEALCALDDDGDGVLRDAELRWLALWQDRNGDGVSDPGEVCSVQAFGIAAITCSADGNLCGTAWNPRGVTFDDGTSRPTYDWIAPCLLPLSKDHP
jgi:hypothetical protein